MSPFAFRALRPDEAPAAAERAQLAFGRSDDPDRLVERLRGRAEAGRLWALADRDTDVVLVHGLLWAAEHWFGGRRVAGQHVAGVAVAPEHRGAGVASAFMAEAARRGQADGLGLSLLFPASTALYRGLGWEHAGTYTRWRLAARHAPGPGPSLRPAAGEADWTAIRGCHAAAAAALNGPEVRDAERWAALREHARFVYLLDAVDGRGPAEAYVLFDHTRSPGHWQYTLDFHDWAATTLRGLQALVGLVGRHGTIGSDVEFKAATPNPWAPLLAEQDLERRSELDWMARALDLPAAVAARGFPTGVDGAVTIAVDDPLLAQARGPWRLELSAGRGRLDPAPTVDLADVRLSANAVGPLFTGYRGPAELAVAGRLAASEQALAWLSTVFAGPLPTLFDFF